MSDDEIFDARQLTARMGRGDADAISQFYDRLFHVMFREAELASRRNEEFCLDIVQESMLKILRKIRAMETFSQLEVWTRRLVRNVAYDQLRAEIRRKQRETHSSQCRSRDATAESQNELEAMQEQLGWLAAQLEELDASESRLLASRYTSGLTLREIGCKYGLSPGAVDGRIRRSLARLRQQYWESSNDGDE